MIEAINIEKSFAGVKALSNVSIQVKENTSFGLLGPNGAGKTSLIRILNQIFLPDSGQLLFGGEEFQPKHINEIGYLPEERGLYKKMEVGEQIIYLARLKGLSRSDAKAKLKYWFDKFEISPWYHRRVEELSKGMQQKVQFIVAVMHQPKLLILDEPFSGFDPINAALIKDELLLLKKHGTTLLLSTHDMGSVEELCDDIALLNRSQVLLSGKVNEIKEKYKTHSYQITFNGNLFRFTSALGASAQLVHHVSEQERITATVKLIGKSSPNDLLACILPAVEVVAFHEIIPSVNEIFIQTVA